ncbi:acetyl-CoA C-acetyltransferase [Corynebacterium cystitidis]|uniref:Acetyl-CoA C-acetyltransferase n=1 Tax=Corynebacterium cystitidis DSM 20524 TaxID=1121357 RepID=A0A1H9UN78_9CORY|nr:acetyl-CoA C-acetyltransferase [Corynebacterium cystitidis]WJY81054.1 3-ketoacyl-CoA thiolase [Corynebacterium cystitidis DSM 20524]SES10970.1 acetyl-CoA C-acetyltransferase [Corynebacterium cystitidis DSM 20524]SNV90369.1 acetyl-CoA acetyltransferase [Corynebacterium cystitidis]
MTDFTHSPVIIGGNRTPFARTGTAYAGSSASELLTAALDGLVARFGLAGETLDEVAGGAVLKHSKDFNLTREAVLGTALDPHTPAVDLGQACATSLEATVYLANKIRLGQAGIGIAAGVDSASDAPIAVSDGLRKVLLRVSQAKKPQDKLKALTALRPSHLAPNPPKVEEPRTGLSMGASQAATTAALQISREAQDELALASHQRLAATWDSGFFDDLVTPFKGLTRDNVVRPDTTLEKLASLKPVFGETMTAGNSTALTDGAAAVLLADEALARSRGWQPLAKFVDAQVAAVDFVGGDPRTDGLLMAPVRALPVLLERNGLTADDIAVFEFHEAFAATVLSHVYALKKQGITIDPDRINPDGSSLAAGHPFAATGARIVASLAKRLHSTGPGTRGVISICAAGGQGVVALLEATS